jgi:hypothetical protein
MNLYTESEEYTAFSAVAKQWLLKIQSTEESQLMLQWKISCLNQRERYNKLQWRFIRIRFLCYNYIRCV